jgi:hypothetical protein
MRRFTSQAEKPNLDRRTLLSLTALSVVPALLPGSAKAAPMPFTVQLSGASEVPPNDTTGKGLATLTFDSATKTLTWNVTFSGLTGPATMAHFHGPAAVGANAPVVIVLGGAGLTSPFSGQAKLTDPQEADMLAGKWYINIHTAAHPGGEIRGQVHPPA